MTEAALLSGGSAVQPQLVAHAIHAGVVCLSVRDSLETWVDLAAEG